MGASLPLAPWDGRPLSILRGHSLSIRGMAEVDPKRAAQWNRGEWHFPDLPAMHGSPPTTRSDIRPAHARAEKDSFVELDRHPQISLLEGEEWAEGVRIVDRELTS